MPSMYNNVYKGRYRVKNPSKYCGDLANIIYRSSWELKFMNWCDNNPAVLEWGSEITIIPYVSPVDRKPHRYFVDFYAKIQNKDGAVQKYLIEIKPERFVQPPSTPKRRTRRWLQEVFQWGVNDAKWNAAEIWCAQRGWKFIILTERDLGMQHD